MTHSSARLSTLDLSHPIDQQVYKHWYMVAHENFCCGKWKLICDDWDAIIATPGAK